jgi:NADH-quinone oxidoreductase subunit N
VAVQHERADGDELSGLAGLGRRNPWLAWPMSVAMLALAGIPGTVGFIGKFQLIHALVDGGYTWLGVVLVIGSMISLAYYLRVIAALWMRDEVPAPARGIRSALTGRGGLAPIAGGSPEADADNGGAFAAPAQGGAMRAAGAAPEATAVAVLFAAASIVFGIVPQVLFDFAAHAGRALGLT